MTALSALWLPILLSAVLVFVASSLIHMASPWHKSDYPKLPDEEQLIGALRPLVIPPALSPGVLWSPAGGSARSARSSRPA